MSSPLILTLTLLLLQRFPLKRVMMRTKISRLRHPPLVGSPSVREITMSC